MKSIRKRIILFILSSLFFINLASGYYIYQHTQEEIEEIFNAEQAQLARTIASIVSNTSISDQHEPLISQVPQQDEALGVSSVTHHYERKIAYQVWDLEGNLLLLSENAPYYPLAASAPGYSQIVYEGNRWHVFSLFSNQAQKWIFTAQHDEAREELIELITKDQVLLMLLVNLLLVAFVVAGVAYGTRPISRLKQALTERSGQNLSAIEGDFSSELWPIQKGINSLLERIKVTIEQERSFNADLSHELRTPLAGLKIHAQNLELQENLSEEAKQAISRMLSAIQNMTDTIEQLLLLNRLEAQTHQLVRDDVELLATTKEVLQGLPAQLFQTHELSLEGTTVYLQGNRALLATLIRNLIENACKYSPVDTQVQLRVYAESDNIVLEVEDSGPGMSAAQKENAVKRCYRVSDSQSYGNGLGLSIVQKIVALHHGELNFLDKKSGSGLIVQMRLPNL